MTLLGAHLRTPATLRVSVPAGFASLAAAALIVPVLAHAVGVWTTTEEFSFGYLIVPIALALAWRRLPAALRARTRGPNSALIVVVLALAAYVVGYRVAINALAGAAIGPLLFGVTAYAWGWRSARLLAFPIGYVAFGFALYRGLLDSAGFAMQGATAALAAPIAQSLGVAVVGDGLVLRLGEFAFIVSEACSGMSSLVSLLALGALWAHLCEAPLWKRIVLIASVVPAALAANSLRVAAVLWIASGFGQDAALGFFHGASSLILFGVALAGMLATSWVLRCRPLIVAR